MFSLRTLHQMFPNPSKRKKKSNEIKLGVVLFISHENIHLIQQNLPNYWSGPLKFWRMKKGRAKTMKGNTYTENAGTEFSSGMGWSFSFFELPKELKQLIVSWLPLRSLFQFRLTCKAALPFIDSEIQRRSSLLSLFHNNPSVVTTFFSSSLSYLIYISNFWFRA